MKHPDAILDTLLPHFPWLLPLVHVVKHTDNPNKNFFYPMLSISPIPSIEIIVGTSRQTIPTVMVHLKNDGRPDNKLSVEFDPNDPIDLLGAASWVFKTVISSPNAFQPCFKPFIRRNTTVRRNTTNLILIDPFDRSSRIYTMTENFITPSSGWCLTAEPTKQAEGQDFMDFFAPQFSQAKDRISNFLNNHLEFCTLTTQCQDV